MVCAFLTFAVIGGMMSAEEYDHLETHCRMLGHAVPFGYCKCLPEGHACRLLYECWQGKFDVVAYVNEHLTAEQAASIGQAPRPKMATLVDLIEQAKKAAADRGEE